MIGEMWNLFTSRFSFFAGLLAEHIEISLLAILIAIFAGALAGILISEFQRFAKPTLGVINFLYTIPSISMLGFLIPFSGVGNATAVIALTVYALLPMVRNTHTGIMGVDPVILEAAKGMGSTRMQILLKIKLPLALQVVMSGIRSMVTMTIALAGIASFIGAGGLGVAIYRGITTNNAAMTMTGSLLIALLALAADFLLGFIERRMEKRSKKAKRANRLMAAAALAVCLGAAGIALIGPCQKEVLHIATKPMTEQYVIGEMLDILIEQDTDLEVELTQGVGGGTSNIQPAMESGEFDLYPEYTGKKKDCTPKTCLKRCRKSTRKNIRWNGSECTGSTIRMGWSCGVRSRRSTALRRIPIWRPSLPGLSLAQNMISLNGKTDSMHSVIRTDCSLRKRWTLISA